MDRLEIMLIELCRKQKIVLKALRSIDTCMRIKHESDQIYSGIPKHERDEYILAHDIKEFSDGTIDAHGNLCR